MVGTVKPEAPAERQLILSIVAEPPSGNAKTMPEFALRVRRLTGQLDAELDDLDKINMLVE